MHLACQFVHNVRQHCVYTFFIVASENPDIYLTKANLPLFIPKSPSKNASQFPTKFACPWISYFGRDVA